MSRQQFTGTGRLHFCTTIANKSAPTVAEIGAGVDLTPFTLRDGLDRSREASTVPTDDVSERFDKTEVGTESATLTLKLYRDSDESDDDAWATLPIAERGFLVIAPFGYGGAGTPPAPAAADRVEVWPVAVSSRSMVAIAANQAEQFMVTFALPEAPDDDAVVAA